jgi:hypothetical protein
MSPNAASPAGPIRRLALRLLRAVARRAPTASRDWADAMLREMDFIGGDWAALFWAMGSTTAIVFHSGRNWREWFEKSTGREEKNMNQLGKKTVGVVSGAALALALALGAFGLLFLTAILFPSLGLDHMEWTHWLVVIVIPEIIFVVAAISLWHKRRPVAAGILLTGFVMVVHVVFHYATHGGTH